MRKDYSQSLYPSESFQELKENKNHSQLKKNELKK